MIEPLRLTFVVACPAEHAFSTWTARTSSWWPLDHTVSGEAGLRVVFQPRVGGRIFERLNDGTEIDWGLITVFEPPRRLRYQWHLGSDRSMATDVDIAFVPLDQASTRVEIEHRGWERLGDNGPARREANQSGWGGLLPSYVAACSTAPSSDR